jgi:hypothetical protein
VDVGRTVWFPPVAMSSGGAPNESPVSGGESQRSHPATPPPLQEPVREGRTGDVDPESDATPATCGPKWRDRDDAIKYPGGDFTPPPKSVEGTVFTDCAYGQTAYGGDLARDAKEFFGVLVLDVPIVKLCPVMDYDSPECLENVAMLEIAPDMTLDTPASIRELEGRHVRLNVSSYSPELTGHYHTRVLASYCAVENTDHSPLPSLRSVWPRVASDFRGIHCSGYPK